jgi:hypothetical protein
MVVLDTEIELPARSVHELAVHSTHSKRSAGASEEVSDRLQTEQRIIPQSVERQQRSEHGLSYLDIHRIM